MEMNKAFVELALAKHILNRLCICKQTSEDMLKELKAIVAVLEARAK